MGKGAVIGHDQGTLGVQIEPANREKACRNIPDEFHYGFSALRIG